MMSNEHLRKLKSESHRAKAKDREENYVNNILQSVGNADPAALLASGASPAEVEAAMRNAGGYFPSFTISWVSY